MDNSTYQFYHMKQNCKEKWYSATKKYVCLCIGWTKTVCNEPYTIIGKYNTHLWDFNQKVAIILQDNKNIYHISLNSVPGQKLFLIYSVPPWLVSHLDSFPLWIVSPLEWILKNLVLCSVYLIHHHQRVIRESSESHPRIIGKSLGNYQTVSLDVVCLLKN